VVMCALCVGQTSAPCKKGSTDRDAVWKENSCWPKKPHLEVEHTDRQTDHDTMREHSIVILHYSIVHSIYDDTILI